MIQLTLTATALLALSLSVPAVAAVSADDAKQLGASLTEFGAVKAGNSEGTIPPYTGGLRKAPAGFTAGSGAWADPYQDDKPLLRIDAKNVAQYADKLTAGQQNLIKKFPASYYIDLYPSHRSVTYPDKVLKATVRNATACKTFKENLALEPACRGGIPFPLPRSGYEVMWNQLLRYIGDTDVITPAGRTYIVDSAGQTTLTSEVFSRTEVPYYQVDLEDRDPQLYWRTYSVTRAPSRKAGEVSGLMDFLDPTTKPRRAWNYTPGQRRVRLAPEFSYDTPVASIGGVQFYDELFLFSGMMDRFEFKLVGKKEIILPYNNYKHYFACPTEQEFLPQHANPACERFELHRAWVVEATLKPGMRHAYSKRTYYLDEDGSGSGMFDAYDQQGALYRTSFNMMVQLYDVGHAYAVKNLTYDFQKGMYSMVGDLAKGGLVVSPGTVPDRDQNPDAIVSKVTVR
ncbi:MAG: hypothetical protein JWP96_1842 [Polaromonas sp.]|nr:hypothetical protein [Polaromonas sp.]